MDNQPELTVGPMAGLCGYVGNQMEAQDILQLGVVHDAFGVHEKNEIFQRLTSGEHSTSLTQHHLSHLQSHLHTPRKFHPRTTYSTPSDTQSTLLSTASTMNTTLATPVAMSSSAASSGATASSTAGYSTVSKLPRSDKPALLTTPSVASRPSASKAQTTSRKAQSTTSRFFKFGTSQC